jgi:pyruvate formate lyase activating enzyme
MLKEAMFYEKLAGGKVHCFLCAHECVIADTRYGICGVRQNVKGILNTLSYAEVVAMHVDPIEKKPLFHVLPGSSSFSIAAIGCNFQCGFCQNWQISQSKESKKTGAAAQRLMPDEIVNLALENGCESISYTYTEPTIFFEFAYEIAKLAKERGLFNIFVTNGFMTSKPLEKIAPYLDAANVDLKYFSEEKYAEHCKAGLKPVLDTIKRMWELDIWVEATTLVIPGQNDSVPELEGIAGFLAGVSLELPWHLSMFHPDYKYTDVSSTPVTKLRQAYNIGKAAGLKYVYLGNVIEEENTYCRNCGEPLIKRLGMEVLENKLIKNKCPKCGTVLPGKGF